MGLVRKVLLGASVLAALAGGVNYLNKNVDVMERRGEIYQGYSSFKNYGFNLLVFDDEPLSEREGKPDLRVVGDPDGLEIGEKYDVKYKVPRWFGEKILVDAKPSD